MSTYYVNSSTGSDGNSGATAALAKATFAAGAALLSNGDTLIIADDTTYHEAQVTVTEDSITIQRSGDGTARPQIRGDVVVAPGSWTDAGSDIFTAAVTTEPEGVIYDWDDSLTTPAQSYHIALHYGHLPRTAGTETAPGDGEWGWAANVLYVNPPAGADKPDTGGTWAWLRPGNGLLLNGCDGATVDGIDAYLWIEYATSNGYAIRGADCENCTIENGTFLDCGWHHVGFAGTKTVSNVIRNVLCAGHNTDSASTANAIVFAGTDNGDLNRGNRCYDATVHASWLLNTSGTALRTAANGFVPVYSHGNSGNSSKTNDVEYHRLKVYGRYVADERVNFATCNDVDDPSDAADPETYNVRAYDGEWIVDRSGVIEDVSLQRVDIQFGTISANTAAVSTINRPFNLTACTLVCTISNALGRVFQLASDAATDANFINCSIHLVTSTANASLIEISGSSGAVTMRRCLFSRADTGAFLKDGSGSAAVVAGQFDIANCILGPNIDSGKYVLVGNATAGDACRSLTNWQANVSAAATVSNSRITDTGTVYEQAPGFTSATDLSLTAAGYARLNTLITFDALMGVNGQTSGRYVGAYQYGAPTRNRLGMGLGLGIV
jgi:hypothetical protein